MIFFSLFWIGISGNALLVWFLPKSTFFQCFLALPLCVWVKENHSQLSLSETERYIFPANPAISQNVDVKFDSFTQTPTRSVDDRPSFSERIAAVTRSCRYTLYNIKIRPYLKQLFVQAMVLSGSGLTVLQFSFGWNPCMCCENFAECSGTFGRRSAKNNVTLLFNS